MAKKLGERLVEAGLVTAEAIEQALGQQKLTGHHLGDCLVELGLVKETDLLRFLAAEFNTRFVSAEKLSKARIEQAALDKLPVRVAETQLVLPLAVDLEEKVITVVMAAPQDEAVKKEVAMLTGMDEVYSYIAIRAAISAAIKKHYYGDPTAFQNLHAASGLRPEPAPAPLETSSGGAALAALRTDGTTAARFSKPGTQLGQRPGTQMREALRLRGALTEADYLETLNILVGMLEHGRRELRGHSALLTRHAVQVAKRMGLSPREVGQLAIAAQLHDLGKPRDRHLTLGSLALPEVKRELKRYWRAPVKLFESVEFPPAVNTLLGQLFEAYDGSGLPQGLKGDDIAVGARIISAVDVYLDLTRNPANPHGRLLSKPEALEALGAQAGALFDPAVVELLQQLQSGALLRLRLANEGRQILLAEPDEAARTDLLEALGRLGLVANTIPGVDGMFESLLAGDCEVAVVSLRFGEGELALLLDAVRGHPATSAAPVVILGEPLEPQARERLLQAGATAIVPMPLDPGEAAALIRRALEDRIATGGPGRTVRGGLEELALPEVLGTLAEGRKSGRLSLRSEGRSGHLQLERGKVVLATFDQQQSEPALAAIVALTQGEFVFDPEAILMELPQLDRDLAAIAEGGWTIGG